MPFGRFEQFRSPVIEGMRSTQLHETKLRAKQDVHNMAIQDLALKALQIQEEERQNELAATKHGAQKQIAEAYLAKAPELAQTMKQTIDNNLAAAVSVEEQNTNNEIAAAWDAVVESKYNPQAEKLFLQAAKKKGWDIKGKIGAADSKSFRVGMDYFLAKNNATLNQRQKIQIEKTKGDIQQEVTILSGAITGGLQSQKDIAAMERLKYEMDRRYEMVLARVRAEGGLPEYVDPTNTNAYRNMATNLTDAAIKLGMMTLADAAKEGGAIEAKKQLDKMAVDGLHYINQQANILRASGFNVDPVTMSNMATKYIIGRVDLDGNYQEVGSKKLNDDKETWKSTYRDVVKVGGTSIRIEEWDSLSEKDQERFLNSQWTNLNARSETEPKAEPSRAIPAHKVGLGALAQ